MNNKSTFSDILNDFVNSYLPVGKGVSPNTITSYKYAYRLLADFMLEKKNVPFDGITFNSLNYDTLTEFFDWLTNERHCSETTRNHRLSALLSFSKYAQNRNFDAAVTFRNSILRIPIRKTPKSQMTWFTAMEMEILLALPDDRTQIGKRNKMILMTLYVTGTRAQELCDLTVSSIKKRKDKTSLVIKGKGNNVRIINLPNLFADSLDKYLKYRHIENNPDRHIFYSQTHEQMTISCVEEIVKKYVTLAKKQNPQLYTMGEYTPHSFRHTTAVHMLEAGVPLMAIKKFLGHRSVQTTQIYAELSQNTVDKYVEEWSKKWFSGNKNKMPALSAKGSNIPAFLNV